MSIKAMTWVWDHSGAEGTELLVLLAIADYVGDDGWCYPRQETLAKKCRISVRTIKRTIDALEAMGALRVERKGRMNWYKLIGAKMATVDMGVTNDRGQNGTPKVTPVVRIGDTHGTCIESLEPSKNRAGRFASKNQANQPEARWVPPPSIVNLDDLPEKNVDPAPSEYAAATLARLRQRNVDG